jgi:hypothetical protein
MRNNENAHRPVHVGVETTSKPDEQLNAIRSSASFTVDFSPLIAAFDQSQAARFAQQFAIVGIVALIVLNGYGLFSYHLDQFQDGTVFALCAVLSSWANWRLVAIKANRFAIELVTFLAAILAIAAILSLAAGAGRLI